MFYWICKSWMDTRPFPYNQIYPPAALQEASLVDNLGQLLSLPGFQRQYHCVIKKGSRYYTISCPVVNQQTVRGYCSGHRQSGTSHFATLKGSFSVKCRCFLYFFAHRFLKKKRRKFQWNWFPHEDDPIKQQWDVVLCVWAEWVCQLPGTPGSGCWHGHIKGLLGPHTGAKHTGWQSVIKTK